MIQDAGPENPNATADEFDWDDDVATLGDRLARARDAAGMNQSQLARRLGVKLATVKNWETDRSEPRANRLQMLSGLLGVSFVWLMTGASQDEAAPSPAQMPIGLQDILSELRELQVLQRQLADRTGQLEKRLKALLATT